MRVRLRPEPNPPRAGRDSSYVVAVTDARGPVEGLSVRVRLFCRSANQPGPEGLARPVVPGQYRATGLTPALAGQWEAQVTVGDAVHGSGTRRFPFKVDP
jgi:hypothetical protein